MSVLYYRICGQPVSHWILYQYRLSVPAFGCVRHRGGGHKADAGLGRNRHNRVADRFRHMHHGLQSHLQPDPAEGMHRTRASTPATYSRGSALLPPPLRRAPCAFCRSSRLTQAGGGCAGGSRSPPTARQGGPAEKRNRDMSNPPSSVFHGDHLPGYLRLIKIVICNR